MTSPDLHALALSSLEDMKGRDIVSMDISKMSSIADHMVVATATSNRHAKSLAEDLQKRCKDAGLPVRLEGQDPGEWILIDLGDVVVHVMQAAARQLYDLESLWRLSPAD